jgi:hypothetical protein
MYNKVIERMHIISIIVYYKISTRFVSLEVDDCSLLERITSPRL